MTIKKPLPKKHIHVKGKIVSPLYSTTEYMSTCVPDKKGRLRKFICPKYSKDDLVRLSQYYLDIIHGKDLTKKRRKQIIKNTVENFDNYFNMGYVEYRKSVAASDSMAAIEWKGKGSIIEDIMGRKFIDCLGGYGIYNTGISHPKIISAVKAQLERMPLSSQELLDPFRGALAEILGELAPGDIQHSFFINNGTDAVEGAIKLARMYSGKKGFISTLKGFHGKSCGSLSLMGKSEYKKPFEPLLQNIHFIPFGDAKALEKELKKLKSLGKDIAGFVVEPVQGEAGAIVPPDDYFPKVRKICDKYDVLLILDEVQTGFGRTGKMFACEHWDVVPDILCLGKSIGGGVMPLSAFMAKSKIWKFFEDHPFIHTSTFGGNPLACSAGIAAINVILSEDLPSQAARKGKYMLKELTKIQKKYPKHLLSVHGKGLLIGMDFVNEDFGYDVASELFKKNILVAGTLLSAPTIRIEPALNIPDWMLKKIVKTLDQVIGGLVEEKD